MSGSDLWKKFKESLFFDRKLGFALDTSRMNFGGDFIRGQEQKMQKAYDLIEAIERGETANPDEKRMVGHYWLRDTSIAPNSEIKEQIESALSKIKQFAADIHSGKISAADGKKFENLLIIGIGGSALGPQFVSQALGSSADKLKIFFFDNTDPDGMNKVIASIPDLRRTLCIVISKSGGTKETRNGQLVAKEAFKAEDLDATQHFVAITGEGSALDRTAADEKWLARFPMWDWVGGRTSELSAVGLLPAALQGFDISGMLAGAKSMDALTRRRETLQNPAALLALSWYHAGSGRGLKDMVVLPYKDRLELFSRYLQQLVMESLGKEHDLSGKVVNQGIAVYGNKGSTDQHAYVQQLRDGVNNFFAVFIEVLKDSSPATELRRSKFDACKLEVDELTDSGDYLHGFYLGTRSALYEKNRESVSITIDQVDAQTVGMLIALFERAVSLYAGFININAYHQPGVEAGKKAAEAVLATKRKIIGVLSNKGSAMTLEDISSQIGGEDHETVFKILRHLAANSKVRIEEGKDVFSDRYRAL